MQKTEKHCKNQCFCYSQNDENQSENGSKNSKIRLRARPPAEPQKKMFANQKIEVKKVEKHGFFSLFACRFWTGAFTNRCLPYCFLQCFLKASVTTYQKQEVLAEKCPPPGKPVTFYECHPEDHAPAPSVRADLEVAMHYLSTGPVVSQQGSSSRDAAWPARCQELPEWLACFGWRPRGPQMPIFSISYLSIGVANFGSYFEICFFEYHFNSIHLTIPGTWA